MTAWPFQSTVTTKEDTARQTTFSSTKTTSNLAVSYRTEGHAFSADLDDNDVAQMTKLPREMILSKNDFFNHLVKILGSFLGLCIIVLIILVIYYIYLKCFWKTRNESEINEHHRGVNYRSLSCNAVRSEGRMKPGPQEQESTAGV